MSAVPVVRIKSTHPESQGSFVEINKSDYDPAIHGPLVDENGAAIEAAKPSKQPAGDDFEGKTVAELRALAADRDIDLGEATKRADIIAAIEAAKPV